VPVEEKTEVSKKPPWHLTLYIKLTHCSAVEIEKLTVWKNNEVGHGERLKHWIIFNV